MRKNITIALVVIYLIGFVVANDYVRSSCTHGNCKHGWNSKYNKKEKIIANFWIIGFPIISCIFVAMLFPEPPQKPRNTNRIPQRAIQNNEESSKLENTKSPPSCPKCGSYMKQRTAKKGSYAGKRFWGCSNYPGCKGIVNASS